jgi:hypothetical protein
VNLDQEKKGQTQTLNRLLVLGCTERGAGRRGSASDEGEGRSGGLCTGGEFGGWSSSRRKWRTTWARPRVPHRPRHGRLQNTELASWRRSPQRSWPHRTQAGIHNRATHQITHRAAAPRIHCRQHHDDFVASLPQRSRWPSVVGAHDRGRRSSLCQTGSMRYTAGFDTRCYRSPATRRGRGGGEDWISWSLEKKTEKGGGRGDWLCG